MKLITVQFLAWVAERPRSYAAVAEAWRSTCPATCAWEDALADGLVRFGEDLQVTLTARGRAVLEGTADPSVGGQVEASNRSTTASSSAG